MRNNIINKEDFKGNFANLIEQKNFPNEIENLLLSMIYKIEDGYNNYKFVKREVPSKDELMDNIINNVKNNCERILVAVPGSPLADKINDSMCKIIPEDFALKRILAFPNEKSLLFSITKSGMNIIRPDMSLEEKAILTTICIGRCISVSEVIRDFNGWSWSIIEDEIENNQCNIIYNFLLFILGRKFIDNISDINDIRRNVSPDFWNEIEKAAIQFYLSCDKEENERVLKEIAKYKGKLAYMKKQVQYQDEITNKKKAKLEQIKQIDETLSNRDRLKEEFLITNSKLPQNEKIFSLSNYAEILEEKRMVSLQELSELNRMQNPNEFLKMKAEIQLKIKSFDGKNDVTKLTSEFLKCFEIKIDCARDKKEILDLLYEIRYLNFIPNCSIDLRSIEDKIIQKAIDYDVLNPVSNIPIIDNRILRGIFETQVPNFETLCIRLTLADNTKQNLNGINVELFDGEIKDREYFAQTPEGSDIKIKRTKKTKILA